MPNLITFRGKSYPISLTDSQRQRCYDAENETFPARPIEFKTRRGIEGRLNRIAMSATATKLRAEFGLPPSRFIEVGLRRANTRSTSYGSRIEFSRTSMTTWVLLHELAHSLAPYCVDHHWPWAYIYLKLVRRFMGAEVADRLRANFIKHGVKFGTRRVRATTSV